MWVEPVEMLLEGEEPVVEYQKIADRLVSGASSAPNFHRARGEWWR